MTRDFIFDSAGQVIGYRCRIGVDKGVGQAAINWPPCFRLFPTARGLWQHQRRAHGLHQQLQLISTVETANISRGKNK